MESLALMPKYEAYKESGVDWLGEVPDCWDLVPIRGLLNFRNEKNDPIVTEDVLSLSIANGVTQYSDEGRGGNKRKDDLTAYKIARPNDIVINSMNVIVGAVGVSKYFGAISPVYYALYAKDDSVLISFYERIFQNEGFQRGLLRLGKGILIKFGDSGKMNTIRMKISQNDLKVLMFPKPDSKTQLLISNFLDQKTAQIDEAIAIKEQQISLLKERKQIIIQQAVTQGLDPNVPMKDSGVDWIGKIPAHWVLKKIKHVTSKIGSGVTPTGGGSTYLDDGIPLLRSQNIHFDRIDLTDVARISNKTHEGMSNSKVKKGDVLLNITGGSIGRCYYVDSSDEMNVNQHVCIVRPNKIIKTVFLNAVLASEIGQGQIWYFQQGGGREGLNFQALKNFYIALPPEAQQVEIAEYIDELEKEFYSAIQIQLMQIEKLKEYKTTLINSAVTGKIKITPEMVEQ